MNKIAIEEFKTKYFNSEIKLLVDVRTPAEYEEVHVKGALNLPLGEISPQKVEELSAKNQGTTAYLICRSGGRSMQALEKLQGLGFTNAVSVDGGTAAAASSGLTVIRSERKTISLERQVRIAAGLLVAIGSLAALFVSSFFLFIPLFVGCGLVFAGITDWCGMGLMIAKCPWNQASKA